MVSYYPPPPKQIKKKANKQVLPTTAKLACTRHFGESGAPWHDSCPNLVPRRHGLHWALDIQKQQGGRIMRRKILVAGFVVIALMLSLGVVYAAPDNPGTGSGGWYCPWNGQGRMMHSGPGWGCQMAGQRGTYQQSRGQAMMKDQTAWFSQGVRCPRATWR